MIKLNGLNLKPLKVPISNTGLRKEVLLSSRFYNPIFHQHNRTFKSSVELISEGGFVGNSGNG